MKKKHVIKKEEGDANVYLITGQDVQFGQKSSSLLGQLVAFAQSHSNGQCVVSVVNVHKPTIKSGKNSTWRSIEEDLTIIRNNKRDEA